ncbi:unnamed protein product (macronuclear) [Paramecium tetraurelia]|uniref:Ysc84 actin-binding domain-containing protein n=1 Tax=Paramecium tetraurelia TaxID=5888 RepID=A0E976_PARTE|nr:uncharacterized protein GSPATT00024574001 [Paramecium tetraurelia]CAK91843.1 unnamed protein product [Paramecium tetraurelia]|eukprot:XP_001459240.1 hypothetical protein (macronuclear) [Paramecium tetraurelia strain d4-2]
MTSLLNRTNVDNEAAQTQFRIASIIIISMMRITRDYQKVKKQITAQIMLSQFKIIIDYQNQGTYGVCLPLQNLAGQINGAIFAQNTAIISGGAVYSFGNKSNLLIKKAQIVENIAAFGGGMTIRNHFSPNLVQYETLFFRKLSSLFWK